MGYEFLGHLAKFLLMLPVHTIYHLSPGYNYAIFDYFDKILSPQMVVPIR